MANIIESMKKWIAKYNSPWFWQEINGGTSCVTDFANAINEIKEISKELENYLPAASPWLPMSEAPKDGTQIFVVYLRDSAPFYDVVIWSVSWWKSVDGQGRAWIPDAFAYIRPPKQVS